MNDPSVVTKTQNQALLATPQPGSSAPVATAVPIVAGTPVTVVGADGTVSQGIPVVMQAQPRAGATCQACGAPYPLPPGATSFRCRQCHHFNSTSSAECPCCVVS